jgi:glycine cleavage system H protein
MCVWEETKHSTTGPTYARQRSEKPPTLASLNEDNHTHADRGRNGGSGGRNMQKWKTVRVRQELMAAAKRELETGRYQSLSDFVSEAIRLRLDELKRTHEEVAEKQFEYPVMHERLVYSANHMWAMVTPDGNVRVGLSDYAQERLKGIVGIQTHPVGYEVHKEEPLGVVETWMFMFDLQSPVSGRIAKINRVLQDEPLIISRDPYNAGWIAEIKPNNSITVEEELRDLMKPHQYQVWSLKLGGRQILGL